ncbi:MAG: hypothetical protein FWE74_07615 [Oscillospiraceae bacterium]|nr:hypothetical protein [Oscillospiraceae bacterium]
MRVIMIILNENGNIEGTPEEVAKFMLITIDRVFECTEKIERMADLLAPKIADILRNKQ